MPRYKVTHTTVGDLLVLIKGGNMAIPEIQRPFVWNPKKVRDLLDSLYRGFPVGYIVIWKNPDARLKTGETSQGRQVIIDGQQRIAALAAAILGTKIIDKNYRRKRIQIAFKPVNDDPRVERNDTIFKVSNTVIQRDKTWIKDVGPIIMQEENLLGVHRDYCKENNADENVIFEKLQKLTDLTNASIGVIELDLDMSTADVAEIFSRLNSKGVKLNEADFAMSKIAANESLGGHNIRKAIDYFCHAVVRPEFIEEVRQQDSSFATTDFFQGMCWLRNTSGHTYVPDYKDMLRVSFTSQFKRGKLADLGSLLSGRNFETKLDEQRIMESSFASLKQGINQFSRQQMFPEI